MKNHNLLSFIVLALFISSCSETKNYFSIDESKLEAQYKPQDLLKLNVVNTEKKAIDSVVFKINNEKVGKSNGATPFSFELKNQKLGYQNIEAAVYFEGTVEIDSSRVELVSPIEPKLLSYEVVNTYSHDFKSFTEGLEFHNDTLYESTGQKGNSYFRKYDVKSGKIYKEVTLDKQYFGEGITVLKGKIYQLSWQENTGFIYNQKTCVLEKTFTYDKKIEGWGMTNDGKVIFQSDGTEKIWTMDPTSQKIVDYINVYAGINKIKSLNELEYIDGKIYANIWQKDAIAIINPANGYVESIVDLSKLRKEIKFEEAEVLNGIAYNSKTKTLFVTGKNWEKIFEIKILTNN
jgi:glutaminyl-peptide cyclotransferase